MSVDPQSTGRPADAGEPQTAGRPERNGMVRLLLAVCDDYRLPGPGRPDRYDADWRMLGQIIDQAILAGLRMIEEAPTRGDYTVQSLNDAVQGFRYAASKLELRAVAHVNDPGLDAPNVGEVLKQAADVANRAMILAHAALRDATRDRG